VSDSNGTNPGPEVSTLEDDFEELAIDRDAILARRAIFVAAALGGLVSGVPVRADAQVVADNCPARVTLDAEAKRVSADLLARGQAAFELGDFDEAVISFQRSFDLTQDPATALQLANALEQRGRLVDAHRLLTRLHQCPDERLDAEAVRVSLLRVEEKTGVVVVLASGPPGVLELDGAVWGVRRARSSSGRFRALTTCASSPTTELRGSSSSVSTSASASAYSSTYVVASRHRRSLASASRHHRRSTSIATADSSRTAFAWVSRSRPSCRCRFRTRPPSALARASRA
jgi:tetratricopeptide (TPR) repeat protein